MHVSTLLGVVLVTLAGLMVGLVAMAAAIKAVRKWMLRRQAAFEAIVRPQLLALLAADDADAADLLAIRRGAGQSLDRVAVALLGRLRGEDRAVLLDLLERRGAIEAARARTYRRGAAGRARAAELLGALGVKRALPELARLVRDRDPDVRAAATRAIGKLGDPGGIPLLLAALQPPREVPASLVTMALLHVGPPGIDALHIGLAHPSPTTRALVAELLGRLGATSAADDLAQALRDDASLDVRIAAAGALGRIGLSRGVPQLIERLYQDPSAELRRAAARSLGQIGDPTAIGALQAGLHATHPWVGHTCAVSLGACGPAGVRALADSAGPDAVHVREVLMGIEMAGKDADRVRAVRAAW